MESPIQTTREYGQSKRCSYHPLRYMREVILEVGMDSGKRRKYRLTYFKCKNCNEQSTEVEEII